MARLKLKLLLFSTFGVLAVMFIRITDYQLKTHFEKKVLTMVDLFNLDDMKPNNTSEPPSTNRQDFLLKQTSLLASAANGSTVKQARQEKANVFLLKKS